MDKGISGNTYDLEFSEDGEYVKVGDQFLAVGKKEAGLFLTAYRMGREHKKMEIRNALGL